MLITDFGNVNVQIVSPLKGLMVQGGEVKLNAWMKAGGRCAVRGACFVLGFLDQMDNHKGEGDQEVGALQLCLRSSL